MIIFGLVVAGCFVAVGFFMLKQQQALRKLEAKLPKLTEADKKRMEQYRREEKQFENIMNYAPGRRNHDDNENG